MPQFPFNNREWSSYYEVICKELCIISSLRSRLFLSLYKRYLHLLLTKSDERGVLGVGSIPVAILSSHCLFTIMHFEHIKMNCLAVKIRSTSEAVLMLQ